MANVRLPLKTAIEPLPFHYPVPCAHTPYSSVIMQSPYFVFTYSYTFGTNFPTCGTHVFFISMFSSQSKFSKTNHKITRMSATIFVIVSGSTWGKHMIICYWFITYWHKYSYQLLINCHWVVALNNIHKWLLSWIDIFDWLMCLTTDVKRFYDNMFRMSTVSSGWMRKGRWRWMLRRRKEYNWVSIQILKYIQQEHVMINNTVTISFILLLPPLHTICM